MRNFLRKCKKHTNCYKLKPMVKARSLEIAIKVKMSYLINKNVSNF